MAHVIAGHSAETTSAAALMRLGAIPVLPFAIPLALGTFFAEEILLLCLLAVPWLMGPTAAYLYLPRERESEADYIGLMLMSKAGYDMHKATEFSIRMDENTKKMAEKAKVDEKGNRTQTSEDLPAWQRSHPHVSVLPCCCNAKTDVTTL